VFRFGSTFGVRRSAFGACSNLSLELGNAEPNLNTNRAP
jgi:hypothetical protein